MSGLWSRFTSAKAAAAAAPAAKESSSAAQQGPATGAVKWISMKDQRDSAPVSRTKSCTCSALEDYCCCEQKRCLDLELADSELLSSRCCHFARHQRCARFAIASWAFSEHTLLTCSRGPNAALFHDHPQELGSFMIHKYSALHVQRCGLSAPQQQR
jgi:hypothetical protein